MWEWKFEKCGIRNLVDEKYFSPKEYVTHHFTEAGIKCCQLAIQDGRLWNSSLRDEYTRHIPIVDCSAGVDEIIFDNALPYVDATLNHAYYWSGWFDLNTFSMLDLGGAGSYTLEACKSIRLRPGAEFRPQPGTEMVLSVDDPGLIGGNKSLILENELNESISDNQIEEKDYLVDNNISIHPNPTNANFNIEFNGKVEDISSIDIYNLTGQHIQTITQGITPITEINTDTWQNGMYIIRITTNQGYVVKKLVKE